MARSHGGFTYRRRLPAMPVTMAATVEGNVARERVPLASLFQWHTRAMNWLKTHATPAVSSRSMLTSRCIRTSSSCSGMGTDVLAAHYVSPRPRVQLRGIAPFCPARAPRL